MASILYCGVCTMPLEYCRYHPKYDKCLAWMKQNQLKIFETEIKDISERNPKIAKKALYLWDEKAAEIKEEKEQKEQKLKELKQTKKVKILEKKIKIQQKISNDQISDITSKIAALSTKNAPESPSKSILKNRQNPNYKMERQKLADSMQNSDGDEQQIEAVNDFGLGRGGNRNKAGGRPPRKDTKKRKKGKKNREKRQKKRNEEEEDEDKESDDEETKKKIKYYERYKNKKVPKNIVEVSLENRKGNKKVTTVRGYLEKTKFKESQIASAFRKQFATSVNITFQNPGSEKGPKQVVLMGDKRHDFMTYLKGKFGDKVGDLLYYKSKRYGLTPAVDPQHGFIMPPPK